MRRYLGSMTPVPVGPFGHAIRTTDARFDDFAYCANHNDIPATHMAKWMEERGRRRTALKMSRQPLCTACTLTFCAQHGVTVQPSCEHSPLECASCRRAREIEAALFEPRPNEQAGAA